MRDPDSHDPSTLPDPTDRGTSNPKLTWVVVSLVAGIGVALVVYYGVLWIAEPVAPHDATFYVSLRMFVLPAGIMAAVATYTYPR